MSGQQKQGRHRPRRDPVLVREARPTDLDMLVELWTQYVSHHERLERDRIAPQGAELRAREAMRADITDRHALLLVAEVRGEAVGYALGHLRPIPPAYGGSRIGVIEELFVEESSRRRGVGTRLGQAMMDWFRDRRIVNVEITIHAENREARAFWESGGFRLTALRLSRRA